MIKGAQQSSPAWKMDASKSHHLQTFPSRDKNAIKHLNVVMLLDLFRKGRGLDIRTDDCDALSLRMNCRLEQVSHN